MITPFEGQARQELGPIASLEELDARLDGLFADPDIFFAIRLTAEFDSLRVRSVARQTPPYKPLDEVAKSQKVWDYERVRGTLSTSCSALLRSLLRSSPSSARLGSSRIVQVSQRS